MRSIFVYSDAAEFGGHEAMTIRAVRDLCQQPGLTITFAFCLENARLRQELEFIKESSANLSLVPLRFKSRNLQALRSLVSWRRVKHVGSLMKSVAPDVVLVSQGRIEGSSLGLVAAKRAGLRTISYIPMAHSVRLSGTPVALRLREMINGYLYRLPDKFITISESARRMLIARGAAGSVAIVPNGITVKPIVGSDRNAFREKHGIKPGEYAVGVIGRVDFRQKGQDFALEAIRRFRHRLEGYKLVFVGQGPDAQKLRSLIADGGLSRIAQLSPWREDPASIYAGLDMLLISSRFEGVPLVMLEAMSYKLPIVASDVDGMAEVLPQCWLFPFGDHQALVDRVLQVRSSDNLRILQHNQRLIAEEFTSAKFSERMSRAILGQESDSAVLQRRTLERPEVAEMTKNAEKE